VKSRLLLDVVVAQSAAVLELLSGEDKTLLIRGNTLLILNLGLYIVYGVRWLNIESDGLSGKGLDENLHTSTKTQYQVKSRLLLDIVVRQGTSILKLLSSKDETLLIWRNSLLILNLGLYIVDGVRWLNIESDGLSGKGLDENLKRRKKNSLK
jgi:uncharacterized membrane protein